jgi:glyoxalase/bleomycin resistance protein/dioxygenase superfamily protein
MTTLGFGQEVGQVIQIAHTVPDIRAAIEWWTRDGRTGPFFLLDRFADPGQKYRGESSSAAVSIAMGFAGHLMIELIQPVDDEPSVYREVISRRGFGFHHVGIAVKDSETDRRVYEGRGYHVAFSTPVPSGGTVYYMGDGPNAPGFIELIPATKGMDDLFTRYWRASVNWDGRNPVRPFEV